MKRTYFLLGITTALSIVSLCIDIITFIVILLKASGKL